tara:strand:+ start:20088 stop:21023 length:936 start_codon:yes stop_codon:yes gene_type:complete
MKILVTGGSGYIGTSLVPALLNKNHNVTVLDNLMYNQNVFLEYYINPNFNFEFGDIRDEKIVNKLVKNSDVVIHLASIVGAPACKKNTSLAKEVNVDGTKNIVKNISNNQILLFASTGSVYGKIEGMCDESWDPNPLSLYGSTKLEGERMALEIENSVAFRFATAYGLSPRLRLDLLPNDFVLSAIRNKYLVVYDKHFRRTFIHVSDIVRSYLHMIENIDLVKGNAFNIGSEENNFTKEQLINKIHELIDFQVYYADKGIPDPDQRDYEVSYKKLRETGFKLNVNIDMGLNELVTGFKNLKLQSSFANISL